MKLPPFRLHRPGSVEEASRLLTDLGDDATAYCGGTELLLAMKLGLTTYEHLVDLTACAVSRTPPAACCASARPPRITRLRRPPRCAPATRRCP